MSLPFGRYSSAIKIPALLQRAHNPSGYRGGKNRLQLPPQNDRLWSATHRRADYFVTKLQYFNKLKQEKSHLVLRHYPLFPHNPGRHFNSTISTQLSGSIRLKIKPLLRHNIFQPNKYELLSGGERPKSYNL